MTRRFNRTLIASDWHLGHYNSAGAARLAWTFLARARDAGDEVILNGDIFEGLFEPAMSAEAAHPRIAALIRGMAQSGQLRRLEGNHDPGCGPAEIVLDHGALGRVIVTHGHVVDPVRASAFGRMGDGISRRFGWFAPVRLAAGLAERSASLLGRRVERAFSARGRALVDRFDANLGIFGHLHRQYVMPGDRYANAGHLTDRRLEFLILGEEGIEAACLEVPDTGQGPVSSVRGARTGLHEQ